MVYTLLFDGPSPFEIGSAFNRRRKRGSRLCYCRAMDESILDIRLLPAWSPSSVKAELIAALSRSELMQAGIAYWTVKDTLLGQHLPRCLRHDSGFVCIDLHPPTEVDALASLVRKGSHLYI